MTPKPTPLAFAGKALRHWWFWVVAALLVLACIVGFGGKAWVNHYLRSESFRSFISQKTANTLKARTEVAPLTFSGQHFECASLEADGREDSWFSRMELRQVRAKISTRRFAERVWQIEDAEIERVRIALEGPRLPKIPKPKKKKPADAEPKAKREPGFFSELLPNRVEVASGVIRDGGLAWKDGSLEKTSIRAAQQGKGWDFHLQGGVVAHEDLPPLEIGHAQLRYTEPSLFVQGAELRQADGGTANVTGEVNFDQALDLHAKLDRVAISPYLGKDWRARLHGKVSGDVRVQTHLPAEERPVITGTITLTEGHLEALPILEALAVFTGTEQFRRLPLTRASGTFQHDSRGLDVSQLLVESEGLIRVEGDLEIVDKRIDGIVYLGVTPATLRWLPGAEAKVFTDSRDGYMWTPVRLSGSVKKPKEDLTKRLTAAAKDALFDDTEETLRDATDAAKEALERLLGR